MTRLATSNCFTVQPPTLRVLNDRVSAGRSATVSWGYVVRPTTADWVGLYASPAVDDAQPLAVQVTNGRDSGSLVLGVPAETPTGTTYQVRLFRGSGARLAASQTFAIWHPTLSVSPTMVRPGGIVVATWADLPNPSPTDWIGLYRSASVADTEYLRRQDTSGSASGSTTFPIPPDAPLGSAYELRLFRSGGSAPVARSNSFRVERASLRVNPTSVPAGGVVMATWSGIPAPSGRDWIGLYASSGAPSSPSISWMYTPALPNFSVPFVIPAGLDPGTTYELRLFRNDGYSRLATSPPFTVRQP